MEWCLDSMHAKIDVNGNIQSSKLNSRLKRIDGIVASIIACATLTRYKLDYEAKVNWCRIVKKLVLVSCVVTAVVILLITLLESKLIKWISSKIDNEKKEKYISEVTTIVLNAIKCVFQIYVKALKKKGNFVKNSQLTALNKAKDIVLSQLSKDNKTTSRLTLMMSIQGLSPRLRQA